MNLIITIDTEEDNWGGYNSSGYSLTNIEKIPALQELFDEFDVTPTYLITYPVAAHHRSAALLKRFAEQGKCDIGSHCHPWNTPPFQEETTVRNSMLCNLPPELQYEKIKTLHQIIFQNLNIQPISFRAGRWGFSLDVGRQLVRLGYRIDTSITPFWDWTKDHGRDFSNTLPRPYRLLLPPVDQSSGGELLELPLTIGFLQENFSRCEYTLRFFNNRYVAPFRLSGLLYRLNILNKVWLSPEFFTSREMIKLARVIMKKEYLCLNMSFHSPSLVPGLTPIVKTRNDERIFMQRIREFLLFVRDEGIKSIKLSEATKLR